MRCHYLLPYRIIYSSEANSISSSNTTSLNIPDQINVDINCLNFKPELFLSKKSHTQLIFRRQ